MRFPAKPLSNTLPLPVFSSRSYPTNVFFYSFLNANLRQVTSRPDLEDEQLQALYNDFFLWSYKYGYNRLQKNHVKRWKIFEDFRSTGTQNSTTPRNQIQSNWAAQNILYRRRTFCILAMSSQDCLKKLCQSGWKTDKVWLKEFRLLWQQQLARADKILGLTVEGKLGMWNYWAKETVPKRKLHVSA